MIWNDTNLRQGLVQDMEDTCGLGATGITSSPSAFEQFTRWANIWNKRAAGIATKYLFGWDFDDKNYTTFPEGTFAGTTSRTYSFGQDQFGQTIKLLKIKKVSLSRDGQTYLDAKPIDSTDLKNGKNDVNIDSLVPTNQPLYDPKANAIDIYPKFSQAEVDAGAKVYVEFLREPIDFATTGTDTQEPGFVGLYHDIISKGAAYEYCKLYKPDVAAELRIDIFGNNANVPGLLKDIESFYSTRYARKNKMRANVESNK